MEYHKYHISKTMGISIVQLIFEYSLNYGGGSI